MSILSKIIYKIINKISSKYYDSIIAPRYRREQIQRDLYELLCYDRKNLSEEQHEALYNVIHRGAYNCLHGSYEEHVKDAIKYSELKRKYVPNIEKEYPDNIEYIYEQFKKDILSSF